MNITARIDSWAINDPEKICYKNGRQTYTYRDLKKFSDSLAASLKAESDLDRPIIVYGGSEFEMIVCFLACAKAGTAYIPIESGTPAERIAKIKQTAKVQIVLAVAEWPFNNPDEIIYSADSLRNIFKKGQKCQRDWAVRGNQNFYIIFTSGTTGDPKGVQISHDNLVSFTKWIGTDFGLKSGWSYLSQAPYSFDLSVMDIYPALFSGGELEPLFKEEVSDFKNLYQKLAGLTVNVWVSTPSFIDLCLMDPEFNGLNHPRLTHFLFCGEVLTKKTVEKLFSRFPEARFFNLYGPTETTVAVTQIEITRSILQQYEQLPIGYAKSGTKILLMDEQGEILKPGETGELVICGPSVSKGYLNAPQKNSEAFSIYRHQPAYHTGDLATQVGDLFFYQGRTDFQVKLHGYRMELEEIERHLTAVSFVKSAIVVPKSQAGKVVQLVAFIVPAPLNIDQGYPLTRKIKLELQKKIMAYMIPQKFEYLDAMPLSSNGKIDRKRLINRVNVL